MAPLHYFEVSGDLVDPYAVEFRFHGPFQDGRIHISRMDDLKKLAICPNLKSANFCGTDLDDVGLEHVSLVVTLESLDLQDTKITNDGLAHLARLPRLRYLRLKENRQLTNQCVSHLLRLENLTDLQIHETSIDQQGLESLATMPNLRDICVDVWNNNYTFDGLLALSANARLYHPRKRERQLRRRGILWNLADDRTRVVGEQRATENADISARQSQRPKGTAVRGRLLLAGVDQPETRRVSEGRGSG